MPTDLPAAAPAVRELMLLTGNCIDRQQLAASPALMLRGLEVLDISAAALARFSDSLWHTAVQATSMLRIEGEFCLSFVGPQQTYNYHRAFQTVELIGLTLWGPQRMMLAYYSQWAKCWIDRGGTECERILISASGSLPARESMVSGLQSVGNAYGLDFAGISSTCPSANKRSRTFS